MINTSTKKSLYELVKREINSSKNAGTTLSSQRTNVLMDGINSNIVANADNIANLKSVLQSTITPRILIGLEVYATSPASSSVIINAGKGTIGGAVFTLENTTQVQIPLGLDVDVFYVNLSSGYVTIDSSEFDEKLTIAKVVKQSQLSSIITDNKDSNLNAYIINYRTIDLRVDKNNQFEEDSQQIFRDNIGEILADNLIGNIRLSENLKVLNTQGSIELDSNSLKVRSSDDKILSKLNRDGTYFYDTNGIEVARFTRNDARIGNMLLDNNSISSNNFQSGSRGFKIDDTGFAEFEDVKIRGKLSAVTFEKDTISAINGSVLVAPSATLECNVTVAHTILTLPSSNFLPNEVLVAKVNSCEEYFKVICKVNDNDYYVTRGFDTGCTYNWNAGTPIVSTGTTGSGYVLITSSESCSPYIDIVTRNSYTCYNDVTTNVRLGNLSGITDNVYGELSGYGLYADNAYLKGKMYAPDIKTGICGSRLEMNCDGLFGYNTNGDNILAVKTSDSSFFMGDGVRGSYLCWDPATYKMCLSGEIDTSRITLKNSGNLNEYTYLCAGGLVYRDAYGETPYIKRMRSGTATNGDCVQLDGFKNIPTINLGISSLAAYCATYTDRDQRINAFASDICYYCINSNCYGYKFKINTYLSVSSGQSPYCSVGAGNGSIFSTPNNTTLVNIKSNFKVSCTDGNYLYYGTLCYSIYYRLFGDTSWCQCNYSYIQPNTTYECINSVQTIINSINFGTCASIYEIKLVNNSIVYTNSGICAVNKVLCETNQSFPNVGLNNVYCVNAGTLNLANIGVSGNVYRIDYNYTGYFNRCTYGYTGSGGRPQWTLFCGVAYSNNGTRLNYNSINESMNTLSSTIYLSWSQEPNCLCSYLFACICNINAKIYECFDNPISIDTNLYCIHQAQYIYCAFSLPDTLSQVSWTAYGS
jgi:hypothetical protein